VAEVIRRLYLKILFCIIEQNFPLNCIMESRYLEVAEKFKSLYSSKPVVVRSPGRINLIGEHTDYNGGFVMPAAINYDTIFAVAEATDGQTEVFSIKYGQPLVLDLADPKPLSEPAWANYLLGVLKQFQLAGVKVKPFKCVFGGDVPLGAGLSSSASVECGFAFALNELHQARLPKQQMVEMAQWAEHNFVGVKCGIMDQFASMMGKKGHVIVLDCRSLEYHYSPLNLPDHAVLLCDTKVKHSLVDSEYNSRRSECERGVQILRKYYPNVETLRDVSEATLVKHRDEFTGKMFDRCLYVVQEISRVQAASADLKANRLEAFGKKMFETHFGLSKMYEVSCEELDFLVEEARQFGSVVGSRMMGGGFGGCTINIIPKRDVDTFIQRASKAYKNKFGHDMEAHIVSIEDGTSTVLDGL
jgi:galactokinase